MWKLRLKKAQQELRVLTRGPQPPEAPSRSHRTSPAVCAAPAWTPRHSRNASAMSCYLDKIDSFSTSQRPETSLPGSGLSLTACRIKLRLESRFNIICSCIAHLPDRSAMNNVECNASGIVRHCRRWQEKSVRLPGWTQRFSGSSWSEASFAPILIWTSTALAIAAGSIWAFCV